MIHAHPAILESRILYGKTLACLSEPMDADAFDLISKVRTRVPGVEIDQNIRCTMTVSGTQSGAAFIWGRRPTACLLRWDVSLVISLHARPAIRMSKAMMDR